MTQNQDNNHRNYVVSSLYHKPTNCIRVRINPLGKDYDSLEEQFKWARQTIESKDPNKFMDKRAQFMRIFPDQADWEYLHLLKNLTRKDAKVARDTLKESFRIMGYNLI